MDPEIVTRRTMGHDKPNSWCKGDVVVFTVVLEVDVDELGAIIGVDAQQRYGRLARSFARD